MRTTTTTRTPAASSFRLARWPKYFNNDDTFRPGFITQDDSWDNYWRHGRNALGQAIYGPFRAGDVRHSEADVSKAAQLLGYAPTHDIKAGIEQALPWYLAQRD